ncbi:MAG TPA: SRPBCC family protein [Bacteroidia bacterium]|nr:SRPBCC family protein [Bacteroidia bacterium]HNU33087.1 SRPBCC family protein [Bacteroidia bacterium]
MSLRTFKQVTRVNKPLLEVFNFFCNAQNLNVITPPSLHFKILSQMPLVMKKNARIDYKIKLGLFSFKWHSEITEWNPPYSFKDVQLKGPYKVWEHIHSFEEKEGVTYMTDEVKYLSPGFFLEPVVDKFFVRKRIEEIFRYRQYKLEVFFGQ